jgi:hypothetical protein
MIFMGGLLIFVGGFQMICDIEHWKYGAIFIGIGVLLCIIGRFVMGEKDNV